MMSLLVKEVTGTSIVNFLVLLTQVIGTDSDGAALDILFSRAKLSELKNLDILIGNWQRSGEWKAEMGFIGKICKNS